MVKHNILGENFQRLTSKLSTCDLHTQGCEWAGPEVNS